MGQLGAQRAGQVVLDVAHRHPARVQRDDHLVEAAGAAGALGDQPRLEACRPGPAGTSSRTGPTSVCSVFGVAPLREFGAAPPGRVALLVAQVLGQLGGQAALQHRLDHLRQEPALPGQRQLAGVDPVHQLVEQPGIEHLVDRLPGRTRRLPAGHTQRMPAV